MAALNTTGLKPLDVSGLKEFKSPALDTSGLTELDVTGLTPLRSQDSWGQLGKKLIQIAPALFKQSAAGIVQNMAERPPFLDPADYSPAAIARHQELFKDYEQLVDAARQAGELPGQAMFEAATQDIQENYPNFDDSLTKRYAYEIAQAVIQMTPLIATTILTRGATGNVIAAEAAGLGVMGVQVYGSAYGDSRASGRTVEQATADATFNALAETIPETIPLHILMKPGGKFLTRMFKVGAAEGIQEIFTEALQAGYDAGVLDQDMTWGQATRRLIDAGIIGAGAGMLLGAGAHTFQPRGKKAPEEESGQTEEEVLQMARERRELLEDLTDLDAEEQNELDWLREHGSNAPAVAYTYGVRIEPVIGERDQARTEVEPLSEDDIASPLPTELIQEGREVLQDAIGQQRANDILEAARFPLVGSEVTVGGRTATVVDAYDQDGRQGAKLRYEDGRTVAESFKSLRGRVSPLEVERAEEIRKDEGQVQAPRRPGPEGESRADLQRPAETRPETRDRTAQETQAQEEPREAARAAEPGEVLDTTGLTPIEQPVEGEIVDKTDLVEVTRANIAGEPSDRAQLIILRDLIEAGTDTMNDGQFPQSIRADASRLSQRIDEALESGGDLSAIQEEAVETVDDWVKLENFVPVEADELRAVQRAIEQQTLLAKPGDRQQARLPVPPRALLDTEGLTPVEFAAPEPTPAPTDRWTPDRGAIPGEPFALLDGETQEEAAAAIVEVESGDGKVLYEARVADGPIFAARTAKDAATRAEDYVDRQRQQAPAERTSRPKYRVQRAEMIPTRAGVVAVPIEDRPTNGIDKNLTAVEKAQALRELGEENKPIVDAALARIDRELGFESESNFKALGTIVKKSQRPAFRRKNGNGAGVEHVRDSFRFKSVLPATGVVDIAKAVDIMLEETGATVLKTDFSKIAMPEEFGWRMVAFDLTMPNGQIVEWYLPLKEMDAAQHAGLHEIFEKWRDKDPEKITNTQLLTYRKDSAESRRRYDAAFQEAAESAGLTTDELLASFKSLEASLSSRTEIQSSLISSKEIAPKTDQVSPERISVSEPGRTTRISEPSRALKTSPVTGEIIPREASQNVTIQPSEEGKSGVQKRLPAGTARPGTEPVQPAAEDRGAERAPRPEVEGGAPAVQRTDQGRAEAAERVPEGAARTRGRAAGTRDTGRVSERRARAGRSAGEDASRIKGENYRIEPESLAEDRGRVQKARDNIRAIELVREIEAAGRPATAEEQAQLVRYVGWGGLKGVFPDAQGKFEKGFESIGKQLQELLSDTEYATARRSLQYAHYTAENVVNAMWGAAERLGFKGGRIFEPGMGLGHFAGLMPADIAETSDYNGLELDHTTARIARLLYPRWGVRQDDYTKAPLPKDTFDLVIGNPPFADIPIKSDSGYPQGFLLHDYFFAKSLDGVRPGGLLAFISSAGTLNKQDATARNYLADRADLIGAIRLPGMAFKQTANTEVTTDILFLRKRLPGEPAGDRSWTETAEITLPDKEGNPKRGHISRYFQDHPEMVLGEQGFFDKLYPGRYAVRAPADFNLDAALRTATGRLPENVLSEWADTTDRAEIDFGTAERKEGTFYVGRDGKLMQQREGVGKPVERRGKGVKGGKTLAELERINGLIPVRDALRAVYAADLADDTANAEVARKRLNESYDAFVDRFGPINTATFQYRRPTIIQQESARAEAREEARFTGTPWREGSFDATALIEQGASLTAIARARKAAREAAGATFDEGTFNPDDIPDVVIEKRPNIDPFMDDPESYRLRSIEKYNDDTGEAKKGTVFFENVITREREPDIKSVNDALFYVLNKRGRLDINEVAATAGLSESEAIEQLGENIYRIPGTDNRWALRDDYLSGNVRRKLRRARVAAERDPTLQRNVDALEAAQPIPLPPSEISANLGMPWIPTEVIQQFGTEKLGLGSLRVSYVEKLAQWTVSGDAHSAAATSTWGTSERAAPLLIQDALNRQDPRIYREVGVGHEKRRELDTVATEAVQDKVREIKQAFADWLWSDPGRAEELADLYNEEYNSLVAREYDGSYLQTPGVLASWQWRPHQSAVMARIIQDGNTYMAHAVGSGKTSAMIGAGMEMRRLGLVRKPMYTVPNHMLAQFTKEFYETYPTARIMVADERRFHTSRRKQFIADAANEDLDAIIITHSAFGMIPISGEFQDGLIQEQIKEYRELLEEIGKDQETRITRSRVEKQIERLEQRLSGKAQKRSDQVFTFEEMGVDFLFVDEAHLFRKLDFATKMTSVKGISPDGSKASWDLYVKTRYLETINPNRNLVLASGTPVTNTMAELFTVSRYLQSGELNERGLGHFDAWAGAFGDTVTNLEQNAAGGYQPVTRFAKFVNVPELSVMVRQVMDVVTNRQLDQYVTRPTLKTGKRQMNLAEKDDQLEAYQGELNRRMQAIAQRTGPPQPGDDIILSVINDGRHAAIDMRLVNPDLPNNPGSKLNLLVDNVHRIWKETKRAPFHTPTAEGYKAKPVDKGPATQLVFANLGLSGKRGFSVPDYIRAELVRRGVPKNQIAFIADYKTHVAKQRLFNDMNEGKTRILVGSTAKMATGVNVQRLLYASHNLDPLWYPADDEQRNGRSLRQGNMNPEIELHDYSTKGTYDSTMWGLMETKARFIQGFFEGDPNLRDMEDLGEASQYEQAKAMTTADPRLIELTDLRQQLERAKRKKTAFDRSEYASRRRVAEAKDSIDYFIRRIPQLEADLARRRDTAGDAFEAMVDGKTFTERVEVGDRLLGNIDLMTGESRNYESHKIGEIGGFDIVVSADGKDDNRYVSVALRREGGHETEVRISGSSLGLVRSLENALGSFEGELVDAKNRLKKAQADIREFEPQIGRTFTGQPQIDELTEKVRAIERELAPEKPAEPTAIETKADALEQELKKGLDDVGISDRVAVNLVDVIRTSEGAQVAGGRGRYVNRIIEIAVSTPDKQWTLDHEIVHALRDLGVIRPAEWTVLSKAAQADKPLMDMTRRKYKRFKLADEKIIEEAIANKYAYWRAGTFKPRGFIRTAFQRIQNFFEALRNALHGLGFESAQDVFHRIEVGEVGRRPSSAPGPVIQPPQYALGPVQFDPERARRAVKFDNPESEARWQEARKGVVGSETLVGQFSDYLSRIGRGFARHYIELPNEPRFSEAREQLRKIEAAPQAAKEEAVRVLRQIVKGMSRKQLDLFTRKIVLEDLSYEVDRQHQLPFGFTPADVRRELAKVNAALTPELRERVQLRNRLTRRVADELVRSGVLARAQVANPAYYRHQVLDYARSQVQWAKTPGQKLKAPHWARRMGSRLDINANLLEAEFEWLQKAMTDVAVADTIEWFKKSDYNIRDRVVASARAHNQSLTDQLLEADLRDHGFVKNGRQTSPLNEQWTSFKQRIAIGLKQVREALEAGNITDIPAEFELVAESLQYEEHGEGSIFPFLSWLIDNNQPGATGAAMAFKAINQRKAWMKAVLGDKYADPLDIARLIKRGFAPEGHMTWQPDEGNLLFTAKTIPEHALDRMLNRIAEEDAGPISADELRAALESVRSLLAVGGPKYQLVLPEEVAKTLNSIRDEHADSMIEAVFAVPMRFWKRWVLINLRRVIKYNLNNLSGDLDAVIAGNPRALRKLPQAIRELRQVMLKGKTPSTRYREAVERGVFDSGLTIQEIPDINYLDEFERMLGPRTVGKIITAPFMKIWRTSQRYTWFRENWLRYAAYLDYVERLEAGEEMRSIGYGAARRQMVDALSDNKDRAALLARELVGDYGAISHYGKELRRKVIPFYSWMEINTKRYWRLGINAWDQGIAQGFRTTGVIGASLGVRTTVWLTFRMALLYGMVQLWNNLVYGDEEDELSADQRARLHLILGRDENGNIRTLRFQGALSDFLQWLGFEDAIAVMSEIEKGRATYTELMKTIAKAPINRILNSLTPLISTPVEMLSGKKFWPDVFQPRVIRDKWREFAKLFSVENEYDLIFDRPTRGYQRSVEEAVVYKRDVGENAYNRIKGMTYDWLRREKGLEGSGGYVTPRSQALYEWRLAKKFGDRKAERRAENKLRELGVSGTDLRRSVQRAHPLGAIAVRDRQAFLKTLTSRERQLLEQAVTWYEDTYYD